MGVIDRLAKQAVRQERRGEYYRFKAAKASGWRARKLIHKAEDAERKAYVASITLRDWDSERWG